MIINTHTSCNVYIIILYDSCRKTIAVHKSDSELGIKTINWDNKPIYEEAVQDLCKFTADKSNMLYLDGYYQEMVRN